MKIVCKVLQAPYKRCKIYVLDGKDSAGKLNLHHMIKSSKMAFCFFTAWCLAKNSIS